jgi:hypothetical protein
MGILQELWADRIAAAKDDGGDKTPYIVKYKRADGKVMTAKKKAENVQELKDYYKKDFVSAEIDYEKLNEGEKLTAKDAEENGHTWMVKFTHCPGKTDTRDYTIRSVKAISSAQAVAAAKAKLPADVRDCAKVDDVKLTDKKVTEGYLKPKKGEATFETYTAWRSGVKKVCPDAVFMGSSKDAEASDPESEGVMATWDGSVGVIHKGWDDYLKEAQVSDDVTKARNLGFKNAQKGSPTSCTETCPYAKGTAQYKAYWKGVEQYNEANPKAVKESADLAKKLVRGEKGPKGLLAKLDHWFTGLLVQKNADRFLPAPSAVKALKSYGFSDDQVHKIREAAAEAAQTAIERMQAKYGDEVPAKYISKMGSSFNVFDLYLNVSEEIHIEFAALMRKLFDAKIDKMKSQLEIVKEDSNLQSLGKSLKGGKVATADEEPEAETDVNTPPDQQEPAEEKPEFKIGDIVKPLKGPHKDEPHDVVKVFDDGSIGIKPKVDDEANKYKAKQAKAKPDEVVLAESVKYRGLFAKGPLLVQLDDRLIEAAASSPKTLEGLKAKKEALLAKMDNIVQAGGKIMMNDPLMKQLAMVKKQIADLKKPVAEAVAGPLTKFKKGQKVTVKKTGEEVTVISQSDSGLVFTMSKDAAKIPDDKKLKAVPGKGYKEYMPRELEAK